MSDKPKNFSQALDELEKFTNSIRPHLEEFQDRAKEEAFKTKHKVEEQVKANPWATLGIVGLVLFVLGIIFASQRRKN